jgi:hypothetical protein
MNSRYRWFSISVEIDLESVWTSIRNAHYKDRLGYGFSLSSSRSDFISGSFLEKIEYSQEVLSPGGETSTVDVYRMVVTKFFIKKILDGRLVLVLVDPPQRKKRFLSAIYDAFGYNSVIEQIKIDVRGAVDFLRDKFSRVVVSRVSARGVMISERSVATVDVVSLSSADRDLCEWLKTKKFHLAKVGAKVSEGGHSHFVEISESGIISCKEDFYSIAEDIALRCVI